jgi:mannosylglycerate hydrolase MGH1-like protein
MATQEPSRRRTSPVPTAATLAFLLSCVVPATAIAAPGERVLRTAEYRALQEHLARGWNTWNTTSVLSHVHLPDGFAITIGLKAAGAGPHYQRDFFQANETLKRHERIRLGPHADDGSYTELTLEWESGGWVPDTPNVCVVQSATEGDEVFVLVTVKQRAARRPAHLYAEAGFLWNRPGRVTRSGDGLRAEASGRAFEVRSTAKDVGDAFGATGTPYLSAELDGVLAFYSGPPRTLGEIEAIVARRRAEHAATLAKWGEHAEIFTAMQTILAWNTVYDPENGRVISPVSRLWNANWGGYVLFDWDTWFAAFMFSLFDEGLAHANAVEVTKGWTRRGFVPNFASAYGLKSEDRSQPPVGSLMALEIYRRHGKRWFLDEVYDELLAWNRWWPGARGCQGVLCWGSDREVVALDGSGHTWQAALFESGLDNSPMYDGVPFDERTNRLQIADVGLTSLYVADCRALAEIAAVLGHEADARELRARGDTFAEGLRGLWDERAGIYLNRRTDTGEASPKLSPTSFYPLIARVPSAAQAGRMAKEHYFNAAEFHGEWVMPSIARNVPGFADQSYWRGRIWGPMNFLVYLGLRNYDLPEARADLARRSAALLLRSWRSDGAIYENYNALTGAGNDVTSSDAFYHWGALLGAIALLESQPPDRANAAATIH